MTASTERILRFYESGAEARRLHESEGNLERERTQEIVGRYLSPSVREVADIGGGPGEYAFWLKRRGLRVHLVDLSPHNVELVRERGRAEKLELDHVSIGNALDLDLPDERFDLVLLLGPLYHLHDRAERVRALEEARRIARPGAPVVCAAITRHASLLAGYILGLMEDPEYRAIVDEDLRTGRHQNPTAKDYFTDAYFHTPEELEQELASAGLELDTTLAVEGFGWLVKDFDAVWADPARRAALVEYVRRTERDRTLLGASAHLLAVGRKPAALPAAAG